MIGTAEILILALIAGLIAFGFGLAFFILGIILKEPKKWIPGAILGIAGFILLAGGVVAAFWGLVSNINHRIDKYDPYSYNYRYDYNSGDNQEGETYNFPDPVDDTLTGNWDDPVSGMIEDADNSVVFIRVFPEKLLAEKGITISKVERAGIQRDGKAVRIHLAFSNTFRGWLQLDLYSSTDAYLGSSMLEVSNSRNGSMPVTFIFDKNVKFIDTDYARLRIAAQ